MKAPCEPVFVLRQLNRTLLLTLLLALTACGPSTPQIPPLPKNAVVLAFGDSLTYGTGASAAESYPAVLERLIGRQVLRDGVPGEVSGAGLRRLEGALRRHQPDLLILCHGGNDFLRRHDRAATEANLDAMIGLARGLGVAVVLIGVPEPGLWLSEGAELYARLAEAHRLPYEGEILAYILKSPGLKSDQIHPNAAGYRRLAEAVAALLRASGAV